MDFSTECKVFHGVCVGDVQLVRQLLSDVADENVKFSNLTDLVYQATTTGKTEILKLLIEYGADVNETIDCISLKRPLHTAVLNGLTDIVELLIKFGADVNVKNRVGYNPLYYAWLNKRYDIAELLMIHGADVDASVSKDSRCYSTRRALMFLAKINVAGSSLSDNNRKLLQVNSNCEYYNECVNEIANMKNEVILEDLTMYDVLTKRFNTLQYYVKDPKVMEVIKSMSYGRSFPIHASILEDRFERSKQRRVLVERCETDLSHLFDHFKCPASAVEKIFENLSDSDLKNVLLASGNFKFRKSSLQ